MKKTTKRLILLSLLAALAMVLSYLESLLPPLSASFPGIKMGLPNVVIVYALYALGWKEAALVSLVRLLGIFLGFGNPVALAYSIAGAILSLAVMLLLKKTGCFSSVGVSMAGGVCHNIGQIAVAMLLLQTPHVAYYLPILLVSGTVAGLFVGFLGGLLLKKTAHLLPSAKSDHPNQAQ